MTLFVMAKRLYCMKSNDIVIKYERQGNETEYNPRWAQSRLRKLIKVVKEAIVDSDDDIVLILKTTLLQKKGG